MDSKTKNRFIQVQGQLQVWLLVTGPKGHCSEFRLKHKAQHLQFENLKDEHQSLLKIWVESASGVSSAGQRAPGGREGL